MTTPIKLDGKALADRICGELKVRCDILRENGIQPRLSIVTTNADPASAVYIRNKLRRCEEIGIEADVKRLDRLTRYSLHEVCKEQHPLILQMPMMMDRDVTSTVLSQYVNPEMDADGFLNTENVSALASGGTPVNHPCTPKGILYILDEYRIPVEGARVCMIGRSNIVGRPLARMLEQRNATVTLCHSKTSGNQLSRIISDSDIVVSATGNREVLNSFGYFCGKTLVDVGMNRDEQGRLCGDFPQTAFENCKAFTPVPGGVGPMTVAMLCENVVNFYERMNRL